MAFTAAQIRIRLQVANCCAAVKASDYVIAKKKGYDCSDKLKELNLIEGYVNSIKGYDPDAEDNCITPEEVEFILNQLATICNCGCNDYVNFGKECTVVFTYDLEEQTTLITWDTGIDLLFNIDGSDTYIDGITSGSGDLDYVFSQIVSIINSTYPQYAASYTFNAEGGSTITIVSAANSEMCGEEIRLSLYNGDGLGNPDNFINKTETFA